MIKNLWNTKFVNNCTTKSVGSPKLMLEFSPTNYPLSPRIFFINGFEPCQIDEYNPELEGRVPINQKLFLRVGMVKESEVNRVKTWI